MRAVWVYGAASSTHPRCFVPSWRTSTIEMMGSFGVNQNLRCVLAEQRRPPFFWFKKMVCSFLSSIPSSNSNCVNKQIQPWLIQPFSGASFSRNQQTNHGFLQLPPCKLPNVQELKENLTDPNAPFGVDLLQLDMSNEKTLVGWVI